MWVGHKSLVYVQRHLLGRVHLTISCATTTAGCLLNRPAATQTQSIWLFASAVKYSWSPPWWNLSQKLFNAAVIIFSTLIYWWGDKQSQQCTQQNERNKGGVLCFFPVLQPQPSSLHIWNMTVMCQPTTNNVWNWVGFISCSLFDVCDINKVVWLWHKSEGPKQYMKRTHSKPCVFSR